MPRITIFSNFINHHVAPLCEEFNKITNGNFNFVSQKAIAPKRISFGYRDISNDYDYVVKTYESNEQLEKAYNLANESDYVIIGDSNDDYIIKRLKNNKLTFKDSEHIFKYKNVHFSWLRAFRRVYINHGKYNKYPLYLLCCSAYAAYDFNKYFAYKNKTYKWGYFPETKKYNIDDLMNKKNKKSILWAGRLMEWKHPEYAVNLANDLNKEGINFELNIIGNGQMEQQLNEKIKEYDICDKVHMLGAMKPEKVREYMEKSEIFIFTSDHSEGWGVVLNEAMNSGCACVACSSIGSVGFLVKNKNNAIVYKEDNYKEFYSNVSLLLNNDKLRKDIGKEAYKTITNDFNAKIAVERFMNLAKNLAEGKDTPYETGLCSKAYPLSQDEMYMKIINNENC